MTDPTNAQLAAILATALQPPGWEWKEIEPLIRLVAQRLEARAEIGEAMIVRAARAGCLVMEDGGKCTFPACEQRHCPLWRSVIRAALEAAGIDLEEKT